MGLRAKVALLLLAAFGVTLGGVIAVNSLVVVPQLREAEARADAQYVRRIGLGLGLVRGDLADFAHDYAVWDDAYAFLASRDPAFLHSNFHEAMLVNARAQGVAVVTAAREVVFRREIDLGSGSTRGEPWLADDELLALIPAVAPRDADPVVRIDGLRTGKRVHFLFGLASIKRSDMRGDSPGWVVFYRFLDEDLQRQVSESMQVAFSVDVARAGEPDARYRDAQDRMFWTLHADDGTPLYRTAVQLPPSMVNAGLLPVSVQAAIAIALVVFVLILLALESQVLRPVTRMARHLQRVRLDSNYSLRLQPQGGDELAVLGRECDSLIAYVEHQHGRLSDLSNRDALSGLGNRRLFDERLAEMAGLARRRGTPLAMLLCDLDAFKAYNDTLGHPAGDEVLRRFGALLGTAVTRDTDAACRYGGEEFAVLLPDTDAEGAALVAARLHERLAELAIPHPGNPADPLVTVSIGVAVLAPGNPGAEPATLVEQADAALYAAKHAGRNRTVVFHSA